MKINQKGMLTLGSWAIGNIAFSSIMLGSNTQGSETSFYQMNIYWNGFNLALAGLGYLGSKKLFKPSMSVYESLKAQNGVEKTFLLNTGLDVGYIFGGLYLKELSRNSPDSKDMLEGFGQSIILQGAFLFTFDALMYFIHHRNQAKAKPFLQNMYLSQQGIGLRLQF